MKFSDEILMAYADGELDADARAEIELAMADDAEIAQRVAAHRALAERMRGAYDDVLDEPVPQRLIEALTGNERHEPGRVVDLSAARTAQRSRSGDGNDHAAARAESLAAAASPLWSWRQWGGMAASLIVGIVAGYAGWHALHRDGVPMEGGPAPMAMFETRDSALLASSALAQALSRQRASAQSPQDRVLIGLSFKSRDGTYCRSFTLRDAALDGLACRVRDDWRIEMIVRPAPDVTPDVTEESATETGAAPVYRMASSAVPPAIRQVVEARIDGHPLDAAQEGAAMAAGWQ